MKKWFSILLLSFYLVSTTELYQLLKIPVLVEHFIDHKKENKEITFIDYLKMHYNDPVKDADYQTDQKLPFVAHTSHLVLVFTANPDFFIEIKNDVIINHREKIHSYTIAFDDKDSSNSIWQPPKFC